MDFKLIERIADLISELRRNHTDPLLIHAINVLADINDTNLLVMKGLIDDSTTAN